MNLSFQQVEITNEEHCKQLIRLLDAYMQDEMGSGKAMPEGMAPRIIDGLKNYASYLGFFAFVDGKYAALANCNKNFSTFKAKPLINIHDFIVHPDFQKKGIGKYLLDCIAEYAVDNGYCRINLEVRNDNVNAQKLYTKAGFVHCKPPMSFWELQF